MTDDQDQAKRDLLHLEEQIQKENDTFKQLRQVCAIYSDVLKVIAAGNATGVIAAGAALNTFSNRPVLIMFLKVGGVSFLLGVFCFAIGFALLFSMVIAASRIPGAFKRGHTMEFVDYKADFAISLITPLVRFAEAGAVLFVLGCVCAFIILIFA